MSFQLQAEESYTLLLHFIPVSLTECLSFLALKFRGTKGRVTETWPSTSAGICAPLSATTRSSTHQWVSTGDQSDSSQRAENVSWEHVKNYAATQAADEILPLPGLLTALWFASVDLSDQYGLLQDNKAMNMFSMDHMLKDGWSGFYSQGFMYFDNCSSLFLPKVCDWRVDGYEPNNHRESVTLCSVLSLRSTTLTSILISPSPAQRYVTGHRPAEALVWSEHAVFIPVFCLERTLEPEPGLAWQTSKMGFKAQTSLYFQRHSGLFLSAWINESSPSLQDISAVAKAWEDSPYLFIVKVQPLFRSMEDADIGAEQYSFTFTSRTLSLPELCDELTLNQFYVLSSESGDEGTTWLLFSSGLASDDGWY